MRVICSTSFNRGIRMINGRKQVLLQDDITAGDIVTWVMHTNATVSLDSSKTTATLTIGSATLTMQILNAPQGAQFSTKDATRFSTDPSVPQSSDPNQQAQNNDQANPGVTQLMIDGLPAGTYSLQVLFNPQWPGMAAGDFKTPSAVPVAQWSLTSHN
jgi:hypothetical protein